jgi:hypothetical protein
LEADFTLDVLYLRNAALNELRQGMLGIEIDASVLRLTSFLDLSIRSFASN